MPILFYSKGTFVFEYDLNVTQTDEFGNWILQLQCMYAPEFTMHSEEINLEITR